MLNKIIYILERNETIYENTILFYLTKNYI